MADYGYDRGGQKFRDQQADRARALDPRVVTVNTDFGTEDFTENAVKGIAAGGCEQSLPYIGDWPVDPNTGQPLPNTYRPTVLGSDTGVLTPPKKVEATMDVWMIWVTRSDADVWLEEAWDDDSVSENRDGWSDAVAKAYDTHGGENVRVVKTSVNIDKIRAAFEPPVV